ncbi:MAG: hypothetical protein EOP89_13530 [Lysobacteraceae bacterium]|nr:MAG: hypothetical protein EOP89_13530 [Xanthomonadaceae bacterium]
MGRQTGKELGARTPFHVALTAPHDDSELRDNQKPITGNAAGPTSGDGGDDRHTIEELTKAGRDIDPNDGSE